MYKKPIESHLLKPSLDPESRTSSANGLGVDTQGYGNALAICHLGAHDRTTGDETIEFQVSESDDNSTFTDITGATTGAIGNVVPNATSGNVYLINIDLMKSGRKRYLRIETVAAGTTPVDLCSGSILLSNPRFAAPVTQDDTVISV